MKNLTRKLELLSIFFLLFTCFIYGQSDSLAVTNIVNQGLPVVDTVLSSFSPLARQIFDILILIILIIGYIQKKKYIANVAATVQPIIDAHASAIPQKNSDIYALKTLVPTPKNS